MRKPAVNYQYDQLWKRFQEDWNLCAKVLLEVNLDRQQKDILDAVQHKQMVSVVSGTARGKDFVSAVASVLFMYLTPQFDSNKKLIGNTKVAMTAPTGRQVENIMYPEVVRLFNVAKKNLPWLPGRLTGADIRTPYAEWFLTGFKADEYNTEAWTGFHAVNTMFVVTEASGIPETIWDAIEGNLQGNSRLLLVFNPNRTVGYAYRSQKSDRFETFRLNSLDSPNVKEKQIIIPGQVDWNWVNDKVENWCIRVDQDQFSEGEGDFVWEGKMYRPNDLFRIKVLGMFPRVSEDVLIPLEWVQLANDNWNTWKKEGWKIPDPVRLGVDVAGMGRDNSVLCPRRGNFIETFYSHNSEGKALHMHIAGLVVNYLKERGSKAFIDTIGEGAGVFSRLEELKYKNAYSCKFSEGADGLNDITGVYEFTNMRAYLFWAIRDWLNPANKTGACLPKNGELTEELTETRYKFQSNGKIIIEPKEDIKKRLGRSPDYADALANTFYPDHKVAGNGMSINQIANMF